MTDVLQSIIELLVNGLVAMGKGIGSGLNQTVTSMFLDTTGSTTTLSTFGGIIVVFAAISLAIGLTQLVYHFVTSLGSGGH